jgi:hypothetical protein
MKTFNKLLQEFPQNLIYKKFKKSSGQPVQLPLPFEFSDEFFSSQKEQVNHILRTMHNMKIGYEFEIFLPKQLEDSESPADTISLEHVRHSFYDELVAVFPRNSNRHAYNDLDEAYFEWVDGMIDKDIDNQMKESDLAEDDPKYEERKEELRDDMRNWTEYDFDEFVKDAYMTLPRLILYHGFEETVYEYGVTNDGQIITDMNENSKIEHYESLQSFLQDHIDAPIQVFEVAHEEEKDCSTYWYIEYDGSLEDHEPSEEYFAVEVSTKTYPAHQWKSLFSNTMKLFERYSKLNSNLPPETTTATGLHFGVSFDDARDINVTKLIVLGQDPFWLKKVNREFNTYCKSQVAHVIDFLQKRAESENHVDETNIDEVIDLLNKNVFDSKYHAINFGHYVDDKYIEFRLAGNDYYKTFRHNNLNSIEWFMTMMVASASKTLWEDEYKRWIISKYERIAIKR